jgi:hypothetical protein
MLTEGCRLSAKVVPTYAGVKVLRGQRNGSAQQLISVFWAGLRGQVVQNIAQKPEGTATVCCVYM